MAHENEQFISEARTFTIQHLTHSFAFIQLIPSNLYCACFQLTNSFSHATAPTVGHFFPRNFTAIEMDPSQSYARTISQKSFSRMTHTHPVRATASVFLWFRMFSACSAVQWRCKSEIEL